VRSANPTIQQAPQFFQPAPPRMPVAQATSLPVASPPWLNSSYATGPFLQVQPSQVARPSASEAVQPQPAALPASRYRATPSPASSMPLRNGSYGRGPAPQLQQRRILAASALSLGDQQQFAAMSQGVTLAGVPLTSMAASSVQQAMPSAANLLPHLPASSLLPGSAAELMSNFLQSPPSTRPVPMAAQQASSLIPGLQHMHGGPPYGAAGVHQSGGYVAVRNQAAPEQPAPEAVLIFQRRWMTHPVAPPPRPAEQTVASASDPHPGLAAPTNRHPMATQQAWIPNPAPGSLANAAGGWRGGATTIPVAVAIQPAPGPSASRPANAAGGWHGGVTIPVAVAIQPAPGPAAPQPAGARTGQQSIWGAGSTVPQGGASASGGEVPVVCLSDDDE
jgi:chromodomain-helicase-DNA-binding protein 4